MRGVAADEVVAVAERVDVGEGVERERAAADGQVGEGREQLRAAAEVDGARVCYTAQRVGAGGGDGDVDGDFEVWRWR